MLFTFPGLLWDMTRTYTSTFVFTGISIMFSGILAVIIAVVKRGNRTRSVSESTDITNQII